MEPKFSINSAYMSNDIKDHFFKSFRSSVRERSNDENGVQFIHEPFDCAVFPNFLDTVKDASLIDALEIEARSLPLHRRKNDLFSLNQSDDLKSLREDVETSASAFPLLRELQNFFATNMLSWMQDVTGAELDKGEVSSSVSRYEPCDYLLCHDDELERRRIAFIIYLVPEDWCATTEGGFLELIESGPAPFNNNVPEGSGDYHPWRSVISLSPARNCLAFFEVCPKSFHQVSEIIGTRDRLSVHGWFMGDPLPRSPRSHDPVRIPRLQPCFIELQLVCNLVNPRYLLEPHQSTIRLQFVKDSSIRLDNFLQEAEWKALCKAMRSIDSNTWIEEGPMDLRNISVLPYSGDNDELESCLPEACRQLRRLLRSDAILVILSQLTGVTLHPLCAEEESVGESNDEVAAKRRKEDEEDVPISELTAPRFHRWKSGMYTLLADADSTVLANDEEKGDEVEDAKKYRLDLMYHIAGYGNNPNKSSDGDNAEEDPNQHWDESWNGETIYVSRLSGEEFARVTPMDNALTLSYCNADTGRFMSYITSRAKPIVSGIEADEAPPATPFAYDVFVTYFDPLPNDTVPQLDVVNGRDTDDDDDDTDTDDGNTDTDGDDTDTDDVNSNDSDEFSPEENGDGDGSDHYFSDQN